MRITYNKLVRDRIPEIIEQAGNQCRSWILSDDEFKNALRAKLAEEVQEFQEADEGKLIEELSDIYEVLDALLLAYGISHEDLVSTQQRKRTKRGGFQNRFWLEWVEDDTSTE